MKEKTRLRDETAKAHKVLVKERAHLKSKYACLPLSALLTDILERKYINMYVIRL